MFDRERAVPLVERPNAPQGKLTVFVFLALVALLIPVRVYDRPIFEALNGMCSPLTDPIWFGLTSLGDGLVLGIILGAFLVRNPRVTALGLVLLLLSTVIMHLIKWLCPTPRPAAVLESVHVVGPLLRSGSFPSGHASSVTAAGLAIIAYGRAPAGRWLVAALMVCIAISRVFVGAHWPSDVIGGMALSMGLLAALLVYPWPLWQASIPIRPRFDAPMFRFFFSTEIATVLFTLFLYSVWYSSAPVVTAAAALCVLVVLVYGWMRRERPRKEEGK